MRNKAVEKWIEQFNASFASVESNDLASLFQEEFFWRDILCISWSLNTFETHQEVLGALKHNKAVFPLKIEGYYDVRRADGIVECFLDITNGIGQGKDACTSNVGQPGPCRLPWKSYKAKRRNGQRAEFLAHQVGTHQNCLQ